MGRKSSVINLTAEEHDYLETQTRARMIQAQTVNRARILLLKASGCNAEPVVFHWKYNLNDIDVSEEIITDTLPLKKSS